MRIKLLLVLAGITIWVLTWLAIPHIPGPQGLIGEQGERGRVIYGLDGADGLQGPRGHRGLDGIRGNKGDAGAQGDPGVRFFSTISKENLVTPKTVTVECPEGSKAIFGDSEVAMDGIGNVPWLVYDFENSGALPDFRGYTVTYVSINNESRLPWVVQVYAICLDPDFINDETFKVEYS